MTKIILKTLLLSLISIYVCSQDIDELLEEASGGEHEQVKAKYQELTSQYGLLREEFSVSYPSIGEKLRVANMNR